ncbi:MAG: choice-of-anchor Q domain-containing protein [bacterium]
MKRVIFLFVVLMTMLVLPSLTLAAVWYVDAAAPGGGGTSWASAFKTIQQAVDAAGSGDEIWVKRGTYLLGATVTVGKAISLYGGFNGSETSLEQRNWTLNVTRVDGNNAVRCFLVTSGNVTVDGFTITRGRTTGVDRGGGLCMNVTGTAGVSVANCIFLDNRSVDDSGGGMYVQRGHADLSDCTFRGNTSDNRGGAVYVYYTESVSFGTADITHCDFDQNSSGSGGALFFKGGTGSGPNSVVGCSFTANRAYSDAGSNDGAAIVCDPTTTISGCSFVGNTATRYGTIATYGDAGNTITVASSVFAGNEVRYGGGICINGSMGFLGSVIVTNCTFSGNTASSGGGAIYTLKALGASSQFAITNSVLWGDSGNEIAVGGSGGLPTVRYSDMDQDGYAGSNGNIRQAPLFVSASDLHLTSASPCIDRGSNSAPSLPAQDIDGEARILDGDENGTAVADMGADELNPGSTPPAWTGATVLPAGEPRSRVRASLAVNALGMLVVPLVIGVLVTYRRMGRGS